MYFNCRTLLSAGRGLMAIMFVLLLLPAASQAQYANTAYGYNALLNNTTGYENSAFGYNALPYNTTGYNNTATGY